MTLYWQNLREVLNQETGHELTFKQIVVAPRWTRSPVLRRFSQRVLLPKLIHRSASEENQIGRKPVVHVLDQHYAHLLPLSRRGVITCHDLDPLVSPKPGWSKREERWRINGLLRARQIHAISANTAKDIKRFFPEMAKKVVVNYYGLDPVFRQREPQSPGAAVRTLQSATDRFFVLHVGSNIERKNIPVLLRGFARAKAALPEKRLTLVKVGNDLLQDGYGPLIETLGLQNDIIYLGSLGSAELVDVYNSCDVFLFPSLYEGFGRPIAEAQACGLPCILAETSSLPEVGGKAALYHPAEKDETLAAHIVCLAEETAVGKRLSSLGLENASRFTWKKHAALLCASYLEDVSQPVAS